MARIIIIRNFYSYYITKSPTLDNMDGSDAILCWQPTSISMYIWCFGGITVIMLLNLHH